MVDIPTIEPFQFIRSTAFSERVQLANKLNEVIDALNQIGTIDDLQTQIDAINSEISEIQTAIEDTNSDVSTLSNQVNTLVSEVNGLLKEVVNEVVLDAPEYGQVRVKVVHEDETETTSNALQIPVIVDGGISLISGTTARSFKIRYITADGVTHTTNDFVIPEGGGGTDVTVTSVTILEGDTDNSFKFEVGLSDGSSIQSNSYPFPAASELQPATTSQLGGIKVGTHLSVTADGTLSVDMSQIGTAASAATLMWTADASKVTLHADSLAGTEFTEDIPQASQGGAGTIDQASYAKIAATESKVNALAPTVTVNEEVEPPTITVGINGKTAKANLPSSNDGKWEPITSVEEFQTLKVGDTVRVKIRPAHPSFSPPRSWTDEIVGPTSYSVAKDAYFPVLETTITSLNNPTTIGIGFITNFQSNRYVMFQYIESLTSIQYADRRPNEILAVRISMFNGNGSTIMDYGANFNDGSIVEMTVKRV